MRVKAEDFESLADVKRILMEEKGAGTQKELAQKIDIDEATLSRMLDETQGYKKGPKKKNMEKFAIAVAGEYNENTKLTWKKLYELCYPKDIVESVWEQCVREHEVVEINEEEQIGNLEQENLSIVDTVVISSLEEQLLEIADKILKMIDYEIETQEFLGDSLYLTVKSKESGRELFVGGSIPQVLIYELNENNYIEINHKILALNKAKGIILLCCKDVSSLNRVWIAQGFNVHNNLILYSMDEERKLYVKSYRKGDKKVLKMLFGENNLIFPRKE